MKQLLCIGIAASALLLRPAAAADFSVAPLYEAPPAPVASWTGSYISTIGGGWGNVSAPDPAREMDSKPRFDVNGTTFGVTAGLQQQFGSWVVGYEGDAIRKNASPFELPLAAGAGNEMKERWLSTFRGRVGVAQNNWLFYATGGAALGNVEQSTAYAAGAQLADRHWHWGWTVGAGVELKFSQDWSAKLEYLYVGLQDKAYFSPAPDAAFQSDQRVRLDDHVLRVGVNYKLPWNTLDSFFKQQ
jgi:opacity protein-like surface antigen